MSALKLPLWYMAKALRYTAFLLENWLLLLFMVCMLSPVSPHIRLPNNIFPICAYLGSHGIIYLSSHNCPVLMLIDTREHEGLLW
ncbi:hypothetical protein [Litorimonas sp.]|uniref:hypothetical protein n=1 Tax=Litorimonas sp. TaxID=1892381 RepID=UPI003A8C34D5